MSFQATVIQVMIASPGDVDQQRDILSGLFLEWNAIHSRRKRAILMPAKWETSSSPSMTDRAQAIINSEVLADSDLLVGVFGNRLGTPTGEAPSGTVEEIERHCALGKPAMLYFSAMDLPRNADLDQFKSLQAFREKCLSTGYCETYTSISDFTDKVRRHIALKVEGDEYLGKLMLNGRGKGGRLPLEGVWELDSKSAEETGERKFKIYTSSTYVFLQYKSSNGLVVRLHGGIYELSGARYRETCLYSGPTPWRTRGDTHNFRAVLSGGSFRISRSKLDETWNRSQLPFEVWGESSGG